MMGFNMASMPSLPLPFWHLARLCVMAFRSGDYRRLKLAFVSESVNDEDSDGEHTLPLPVSISRQQGQQHRQK